MNFCNSKINNWITSLMLYSNAVSVFHGMFNMIPEKQARMYCKKAESI